jgi:hypothetical protein
VFLSPNSSENFTLLPDFAVARPLEDVVLLELPAERQLAAFFRNGLHLVDQLLLVLEQGCSGFTVRFAFVGITKFTHAAILFLEGAPCGSRLSVP